MRGTMDNDWLQRPVGRGDDHVQGAEQAENTLVEYGAYACPHCQVAHREVQALREQFGERLRYVWRHRPLTGNAISQRAAELAERVAARRGEEGFWALHERMMQIGANLNDAELDALAEDFGLPPEAEEAPTLLAKARDRVARDQREARDGGLKLSPSFYINARRYRGPWDTYSLGDAMLGRFGRGVQSAALEFARRMPSTGLLLLGATLLALALSNSPLGENFAAFWEHEAGLLLGEGDFRLSLLHWINDGLLTLFFLVVGLEIKHEFTVGHLSERRSAALPVAGALGGMLLPAALFLLLAPTEFRHGWGVPMATDTAFALAIIVVMGRRVPVELRVFLTAAAIVDDIGAILVVALFYTDAIHLLALAGALGVLGLLAALNAVRVYSLSPYLLLGVLLWLCIHASGLHATLAGVLLALFIPTRPPPNLEALMTQASVILRHEASKRGDGRGTRRRPSLNALRAMDSIHDRLTSPAERLLAYAAVRSSYVVLPLFALANAGVRIAPGVFTADHLPLMAAVVAGLVVGKPVGMFGAAWLAVRSGLASKPSSYGWRQLGGASALAGIGFTMSLFIAGQAFPVAGDFAAAKIAVFSASILAALLGFLLLWFSAPRKRRAAGAEADGRRP